MTPEQLAAALRGCHPTYDERDAAADLIESQAQRIRELEGAAITLKSRIESAVEELSEPGVSCVAQDAKRTLNDALNDWRRANGIPTKEVRGTFEGGFLEPVDAALRSESHQASAEEKA